MVETMYWADDALYLLDQRALPNEVTYVKCGSAEEISASIQDMVVRGAPAIGVAAAYGVTRAVQDACSDLAVDWELVSQKIATLRASRPTAVNLMWAIDRMAALIDQLRSSPVNVIIDAFLPEAKAIELEDVSINQRIGDHGSSLCRDDMRILTYCNAGALATAGYGTALGVIRSAYRDFRNISVYACETRPYLQGARLTAWELMQDKIPVTLMADNMVGYAMDQGLIDLVVVGTDRVAANGDVANKIGTYTVATMARRHAIPFYVACPVSTIDFSTAFGDLIPIEQRAPEELTGYQDKQWAPSNVNVLNPSFDVTPSELVAGLITEYGIVPSTSDGIRHIQSVLSGELR